MSVRVYDLMIKSRREALGIDNPQPEFAWKFTTSVHNATQLAYTIQVSVEEEFNRQLVWDTGKITSNEQFGIVYAGHSLQSMLGYFWRVCIWDASDTQSEWSEIAFFETAILNPSHWFARWITSSWNGENDKATLYLRGSINLFGPIL